MEVHRRAMLSRTVWRLHGWVPRTQAIIGAQELILRIRMLASTSSTLPRSTPMASVRLRWAKLSRSLPGRATNMSSAPRCSSVCSPHGGHLAEHPGLIGQQAPDARSQTLEGYRESTLWKVSRVRLPVSNSRTLISCLPTDLMLAPR